MKPCTKLQARLGLLAGLREREVDRLQAELGQAQALCARYEKNIARLEELSRGLPAGERLCPNLALNNSAYKQSVLKLAQSQRADLAVRRVDVGHAQAAVHKAAREQQVIGVAFDQVGLGVRGVVQRQAQKRLDEVATQMWLRGRRDV
jgi:hypothetical protein